VTWFRVPGSGVTLFLGLSLPVVVPFVGRSLAVTCLRGLSSGEGLLHGLMSRGRGLILFLGLSLPVVIPFVGRSLAVR
jgi:uncharacterized membrane protein YesL